MTLAQSATAVAPNCPASFLAAGGTAPYIYSVVSGGAGGAISPTTGAYVAPAQASSNPNQIYDTIRVIDAASATTTRQILVGVPLRLLCEIIQREMQLSIDRVYLWDQKKMMPKDDGLWVVVSEQSCKPFGNVNKFHGSLSENEARQYVAMQALVGIDMISRGPSARDRKEELISILKSDYAQRQQTTNSFMLASIPSTFVNLSEVDGAAIPYRYHISLQMQYAYTRTKMVSYFDDFPTPVVTTDP